MVDASGDADVVHYAGAPYHKTPKERCCPVTVMFSVTGADKKRFLDYVAANPSTYKDWGLNWDVQKGGKEDDLFSPYLAEPFDRARAAGVIPPGLKSIGGTWSTITDSGEATYLNMIHLTGYDGTDVWDLTKAEIEGRSAGAQAIKAMNHFAPGFERAKLRTYGMTVGIRDTRKIAGSLRPDGARRQERSALRRLHRHLPGVHRRLRRARSAHDGPLLPDTLPRARAEEGATTSSSPAAASRATPSRMLRCAA